MYRMTDCISEGHFQRMADKAHIHIHECDSSAVLPPFKLNCPCEHRKQGSTAQ